MARKSIKLEINKNGSVVQPRLHDGYLTKMELVGEEEVILGFKSEDGRQLEFALSGLLRCKAVNFLEGNIILDVILHRGQLHDAALLEELLSEAPEPSKRSKYFDDILQRLGTGALTLVEVQPSYGCYLLALCREVNAYEVE